MAVAAEIPLHAAAPNPMNFFQAVNGFHRSAAIKTAVELDVFTAIAEGATTPASIAEQRQASERGIRILCDFLVVNGFLLKQGGQYALTPDSAMFLNRKSQAYLGSAVEFLLNPKMYDAFDSLTESVRRGGSALEKDNTAPEDPVWIYFARCMMGLSFPITQGVAGILSVPDDRDTKVLDIAASHGMYGIALAKRHPRAHIAGLDWKNVLELTKENAQRFGVADRYSTIAGSAFDVDFGSGYDVVLLPNFLHHFNREDCVKMLAKCRQALAPGGCVAIVEFVPNDDRVSPPASAAFPMIMLATTPEGDAYTLREYHQMLSAAGFKSPAEAYPLPPAEHVMIVARRE